MFLALVHFFDNQRCPKPGNQQALQGFARLNFSEKLFLALVPVVGTSHDPLRVGELQWLESMG